MINNDFLKGVFVSLGIIVFLGVLGSVFAVGFHYANEILPGSFAEGNYSFNGSLGIGTDSPAYSLTVNGSGDSEKGSVFITEPGSSTGSVKIGSPNDDPGVEGIANNGKRRDIRFMNSGMLLIGSPSATMPNETSGIFVSGTGSVGIGTLTPGHKLAVMGNIGLNHTSPQIKFEDSDGDSYWLHNNGGILYFLWNGGSGDTWTTDRPLNVIGENVSIGTTSSTARLQVNGNIVASDPTASNHVATKSYVDAAASGTLFYVTTSTYDGANADTGCDSGYHMCYLDEWVGAKVDTGKDCAGCWDSAAWIDLNSNFDSNPTSGDCSDWTTTGAGDYGATKKATDGGWVSGGSTSCSNSYRVMCCSD